MNTVNRSFFIRNIIPLCLTLFFGLVAAFSALYPEQSIIADKTGLYIWRQIIISPLIVITFSSSLKPLRKYTVIFGLLLCGAADVILSFKFDFGLILFFIFNIIILINLFKKKVFHTKRYYLIIIPLYLVFYIVFSKILTGTILVMALLYSFILINNIYFSFYQTNGTKGFSIAGSFLFLISDIQVVNDLWFSRLPNSSLINNILYYSALVLYVLFFVSKGSTKPEKNGG